MQVIVKDLQTVDCQSTACWSGLVTLPEARHPVKILIFQHAAGFNAIRARCPHQSVDLTGEAPDENGFVTCPLHNLQINLLSGPYSLQIEQQDDEFYLVL